MKPIMLIKMIFILALFFTSGAYATTAIEFALACNGLAQSTCASNPNLCSNGGVVTGDADQSLGNVCKYALGGTFVSYSDAGLNLACSVCIGATNQNANSFSAICNKKLKALLYADSSISSLPVGNSECIYTPN